MVKSLVLLKDSLLTHTQPLASSCDIDLMLSQRKLLNHQHYFLLGRSPIPAAKLVRFDRFRA